MAWTSSVFSTALDLLEAGLRHSVWLWVSLAGAVVLLILARRARPIILRSSLSICAFGLALSGVLNTVAWMDARYQLTAPMRALAALQQNGAQPAQQRVLILNAPDQITLNSAVSGLPEDAESLRVPGIAGESVITFAQMIEGDVGAPGQINGLTAHYNSEIKLNHAQMVALVTHYDLVIVARGSAQGFEARVVGERIEPAEAISTSLANPYLARFESNENVVLLYAAHACLIGNLLHQTLVTHTTLQVAAGHPVTAKLFRHALAKTSQQQIGGNDLSLFGGLLELNELPVGQVYKDISPFETLSQPNVDQVKQVHIGFYDWQTGERWLALRADNTQWPDNAVIIDVQSVCE